MNILLNNTYSKHCIARIYYKEVVTFENLKRAFDGKFYYSKKHET